MLLKDSTKMKSSDKYSTKHQKNSEFQKIWCALLSYYLRFEIRPFALLLVKSAIYLLVHVKK